MKQEKKHQQSTKNGSLWAGNSRSVSRQLVCILLIWVFFFMNVGKLQCQLGGVWCLAWFFPKNVIPFEESRDFEFSAKQVCDVFCHRVQVINWRCLSCLFWPWSLTVHENDGAVSYCRPWEEGWGIIWSRFPGWFSWSFQWFSLGL